MKKSLMILLSLIGTTAWASEEAPQSLTLDGRLYSNASAKTPLLDTGKLKIQILDYNGTCVLYEEEQSFDTRATGGGFNINVGEKVGGTTKRTVDDSGNTLAKIFSNSGGTIPGKLLSNGSACAGNATAGLDRSILITVTPDSDPTPRAMTAFGLSSVPSAITAERAESLEGIKSSGFLQVRSTAPYSLSQLNIENIFSTANYTKLTDLLGGASSLYVHATANGTILAPAISGTPPSPAAGQIWYDSGTVKYWDGSTTQTLSSGSGITSLIVGAGLTPTGTISTGGSTIAVDVGVTAGKIVQVQTGGKLPALDGSNLTGVVASSLSGTASINTTGTIQSGAITSSSYLSATETRSNSVKIFKSSTTNYVELVAPTSLSASVTYTLPGTAPGGAGYVLSSDTSGNLSWVTQTAASISALTGDVTASGSGSVAATVAKIQGVGVSVTGPTSAGQVLRYDGSAQYAPGFIGVADVRSAVAGNAQFFPTNCTAGQTLTWASGTDTMVCTNISSDLTAQVTGTLPVANGGTNSSTALANNQLMISSGGKIVEAGAMTDGQIVAGKTGSAPQLVTMSGDATISNTGAVTLKNTGTAGTYAKVTTDAQGRVTSGTTLDATDIPDLDWAKITSGTPTTLAGYGITDAVKNGGQAGAVVAGTTDATSFTVKTDNTDRVTILSSGNVGIGTATPGYPLSVQGDIYTSSGIFRSGTNSTYNFASSGNFKLDASNGGGGELAYRYGSGGGWFHSFYTGSSATVPGLKVRDNGIDVAAPSAAANPMQVFENANLLMIVKGNGNVGIGTNNPADKLQVAGKIRATHICAEDGSNCKDLTAAWNGGGGSVTDVTAGAGLTGGTITASGIIGLGTELAAVNALSTTGFVKRTGAGGYSTATSIGLTSDVTDTLPVANGGTNSSTTLSNDRLMISSSGKIVEASAMTDGQILVGKTGSAPQLVSMSGDATVSNTGAIALKNTGTAGTYAKVTTDAQGRVTSGTTSIAITDIKSTQAGNAQFFPTTCTAGQTLTWQSGTDTMACTNISVTGSQVSGVILNGGQTGAITAGTTDANAIAFKTNNADRVTITSSGYVGVGTSSPILPLQVNASDASTGAGGNTNSIGILNTDQTTNNWAHLKFMTLNSASTAISGAVIGSQFKSRTAGAETADFAVLTRSAGAINERFRITATGGVGIGTSVPIGTLHTYSTGAIYFDRPGGTAGIGSHLFMRSSGGTFSVPAATPIGDTIGTIRFSGHDGTDFKSTGAAIASVATETFTPTTLGSALTFSTIPNTTILPVERVRIDHDGRVGIGTTSPAASLHIVQTTGPGLFVKGVTGVNSGNADIVLRSATNTAQWSVSGAESSGAFSIWDITNSKGPFTIDANTPSNTFHVKSNGSVVIGNPTAASKLAVGSSSVFDSSLAEDLQVLVMNNGSVNASAGGRFGLRIGDGVSPNKSAGVYAVSESSWANDVGMSLFTSNGTYSEKVRITAAGNVGIGTTSPADKLHVAGKIRATHICAVDGTNCKDLTTAWGSGGSVDLATGTTGTLAVANGGTNSSTALSDNRLMISSSGKIVEAAAMTDGQIVIGKTGSAPQLVTMSGDATVSNTGLVTVAKLQGIDVSATTPTTSGQVLRFDGSSWKPNFVAMTDLRSGVTGTSTFASSCLNNQTLTYNSVGDTMNCANISLPASQITGTATAFVLNGGQAGAVTAGTNDTTDLTFETNNSPRMTVSSSGNIGVGTTAPETALHVHTSAANGEIRLSSSGGGASTLWSGFVDEHYRGTATSGHGAFNVKLARGTNSSPVATQAGDVIGAFGGYGHDGTNSQFLGAMVFEAEGNTTSSNPPGKINFITSGPDGGGTRLAITSAGNIGIGMTGPTEKLGIYDQANSTSYRVLSRFEIGNNSDGSQLTRFLMGQTAPNSFFLETSNQAGTKGQLVIQPWGGNVGIGTITPDRLLHVNGPMRVTASALPNPAATGDIAVDSSDGNKLKWFDGSDWKAAGGSGGGMAGSADITGSSYTITSGQNGYYFTFNGSGAGTINLPAISGLSDGFQVTIIRQAAQAVTITANGSDSLPSGLTTLDMRGQNIQSLTLTMMNSKWNITNKTDDCVVGQSCWGTGNLYVGVYQGHQYFTTPGGCTDSTAPTCAGGTDSVTKKWAGSAPESSTSLGLTNFVDGRTQSATLAGYTTASAAKFCDSMTYAGYTDWYLPSRQELNFLYQKSGELGGFNYESTYWSSTEYTTTNAWNFYFQNGSANYDPKTTAYNVRCVRRF